MDLYLGIDGGGTKTRCLVVDAEGEYVGSSISGPTNINTTSPEKVAAHLNKACYYALHSVSSPDDQILDACVALAGSASESNREKLNVILANLPFSFKQQPFLQTDVETALNGAFCGASGIILIAGTGSISMAKDGNGDLHRSGGLGALIGDEGGGYWIGKKTIETAIAQPEGAALQSAVLKAFNAGSAAELTPMEYPLIEVAALCPVTLQLAEEGDDDATAILQAAIQELTHLVKSSYEKAGASPRPLALVGGLFEGSPFFKNTLITAIQTSLPEISIQDAKLSALQGAVLAAHARHNGSVDPKFLENLTKA